MSSHSQVSHQSLSSIDIENLKDLPKLPVETDRLGTYYVAIKMSNHQPKSFSDLPQEIKDTIWSEVRNEPGVHFFDYYRNQEDCPFNFRKRHQLNVVPIYQNGPRFDLVTFHHLKQALDSRKEALAAHQENRSPRNVFELPPPAGEPPTPVFAAACDEQIKLTLPQIQTDLLEASAYYARDLRLRLVDRNTGDTLDELKRLEDIKGKSASVDTWDIHVDPTSKHPTCSIDVDHDKDLVCLLRPLYGMGFGALKRNTPLQDIIGGETVQQIFKRWVPHADKLKYLAVVWDEDLYPADCDGCSRLQMHYKQLRKQARHRAQLRSAREERGLPKPACRMCTGVNEYVDQLLLPHVEAERKAIEKEVRQEFIDQRLSTFRHEIDCACPVSGHAGSYQDLLFTADRFGGFCDEWGNMKECSLKQTLLPLEDVDDDTVSVCSNDADDDDFRFYNISGQAVLTRHCSLPGDQRYLGPFYDEVELKPSSFEPQAGQDPKKVPWNEEDIDSDDTIPRVRHGDHPCCCITEPANHWLINVFGFHSDLNRGLSHFRSLKTFYMIDYSITLGPEVDEIPLDGRHWFDGLGGLYIEVDPAAGHWVVPTIPYRRSVFEMVSDMRKNLRSAFRIEVLAYLRVRDRTRLAGLVDSAIGDSTGIRQSASDDREYSDALRQREMIYGPP